MKTRAAKRTRRLNPSSIPFVFDLIGLHPVQDHWRLGDAERGYYACNGLAAHYVRKCLEYDRTVQYAVGDFEALHRPHLSLATTLGLSLCYTLGFGLGWDDYPRWSPREDSDVTGYRDGWASAELVRDRLVKRAPVAFEEIWTTLLTSP